MGDVTDRRPHSRACGWREHPHGSDCASDCPTCHGKPPRDAIRYGRFAMLRDDLYARSPDSRRRVAERLAEVRTSQDVTQVQLAATIGTTQSAVSRIERQNDILVSTLREYVAATGGRLRLLADYGDHHVEFTIAFEIEIESEDSGGLPMRSALNDPIAGCPSSESEDSNE